MVLGIHNYFFVPFYTLRRVGEQRLAAAEARNPVAWRVTQKLAVVQVVHVLRVQVEVPVAVVAAPRVRAFQIVVGCNDHLRITAMNRGVSR